jgi:hypothetical protein
MESSGPRNAAEEEVSVFTTQRLLCRLNIHHRWEMRSAEDGTRYARCGWCYKDATGKWGSNINPFGPIRMR